MSETDHQNRRAGITAIIYVCGTDGKELDDAERSCREYADRFGWHVLKAIRDNAPGNLLAKAARPGTDIILTGSPDMISPDKNARDHLVMTLERAGCIVHPLSAP